MPKVRLGVALLIPTPVADEVDGLRRALGDGALGRLPAHLTLVPPVNVRLDEMPAALARLRDAAAATRPFVVTLGPVAAFEPVNPVLYLEVGGDVAAVHAVRDRVFRDPLARPLTWPFVPHVTIADDAPPDRIAYAVAALHDYRIDVTFDRIHLLEEQVGRVWVPIAEAPFSARAVVGRGGLALELSTTELLDPEATAFADAEWDQYTRAVYGPDAAPDQPIAIVARREGVVVGVATGRITGATAYLARLVVDSGRRGEGIGAHVLAAFESAAVGAGCDRLTLRTRAGGDAEQFYRRHGWTAEQRLRNWRHGLDFVVLERHP